MKNMLCFSLIYIRLLRTYFHLPRILTKKRKKINKIMNDQEINEIILGAFVKAKWLHKYLPFDFRAVFEKDTWYSDEIGIE